MLEQTDKTQIQQMIAFAVGKAIKYQTRKWGDTPTDMLQLVPKKYVDGSFGKSLFDQYVDKGNVSTGETTLYTNTLLANSFMTNGDKLEAGYGGVFVSSGTATRQIKIYFGGTLFFDTGALTLSLSSAWSVYFTIIRVSPSVVRTITSLTTEGATLAAYTRYTEITGLSFSSDQALKITGQAAGVGAADNDIVAKLGSVYYFPSAT